MQGFQWLNEPAFWRLSEGKVWVKVDPKTDFWRKTHYGFTRDNGHFYYRNVQGDFLAKVKISGLYSDLYDQAGLMIRQDERNWVKTGIEYVNGQQQVSAVVTREFSDWSVATYPNHLSSVWLRVFRKGDFVEISYSREDDDYQLLRLAYLPPSKQVSVGLMAAAPDGGGFEVSFSEIAITTVDPST